MRTDKEITKNGKRRAVAVAESPGWFEIVAVGVSTGIRIKAKNEYQALVVFSNLVDTRQ